MTVPNVKNITARVATFTASGYIDGIRDHIVSVDNEHLTVDAYAAGEGLTIGFLAGGENQQVNLRKSGANTIAVSIEPSGSITAPGDSVPTAPTGTSADWSGSLQEPNWDVSWGTPGAGSKVWIVELADAFFVWTTDTGDDFFTHVLHAGRIVTPLNSADAPAAGQDGLGYAAGVPDNNNGTGTDWLGSTSPCSSLHWATNEWSEHAEYYPPHSNNLAVTPLASETAYRPLGVPVHLVASDIEGQVSVDGVIGPFKYIRIPPTSEDTKSIIPATVGNQGWIHYNDTATAAAECAIWDKTVTP